MIFTTITHKFYMARELVGLRVDKVLPGAIHQATLYKQLPGLFGRLDR